MIEERNIQQWKEWNHQGFIPGPEETEVAFTERIAFCQNLAQKLTQKVEAQLPFEVGDQQSQDILEQSLPLTQELYGIDPQWVPLFFSNYHLAPWHGGCAWIFQLDEHTPTAAFLQLRAHFRLFPSYLRMYNRKELIAHELVHVGRMLYYEPQFEEILAYQTSSSQWRRWFGPIVQSSKESLLFIFILSVVVLADAALFSLENPITSTLAYILKSLPILLVIFALLRLYYRHKIFNRCLRRLEKIYPHPQIAKHLIYRLRDSEIRQFSQLTLLQIQNFIEHPSHSSFRWRFLKALYSPIALNR